VQARAKLTSKGQITLPSVVRKPMGLSCGDTLIFETKGNEIVVSPQKAGSVFTEFRGSGTLGIAPGKRAVLDWVRQVRGEL
jgi:AbrB family looped-hinge helix DNA binding protein